MLLLVAALAAASYANALDGELFLDDRPAIVENICVLERGPDDLHRTVVVGDPHQDHDLASADDLLVRAEPRAPRARAARLSTS